MVWVSAERAMTTPLRIIFMGTPDFAATALRALLATPHQVAAVCTQPPRPKGRGHMVQKSPVQQLAEEKGIPVHAPPNFKSEEALATFEGLKADVAVVAAYGLILPQRVLDAPRHGCLNIHASLLPRWRGASPIQHAIWKGDRETGVTIMQMNRGLDTGPMISSESVPLTSQTTTPALHDTLAEMGGRLIVETLNTLARKNRLCHTAQDDAASTYAPLLKKEDGKIEWNNNAEHIDRQVRALNPWPGTYCFLPDGMRIKVVSVTPQDENTSAPPGTVLNAHGDVACGEGGVLRLVTIQPEGKKPMPFTAALNGGYLKINSVLS